MSVWVSSRYSIFLLQSKKQADCVKYTLVDEAFTAFTYITKFLFVCWLLFCSFCPLCPSWSQHCSSHMVNLSSKYSFSYVFGLYLLRVIPVSSFTNFVSWLNRQVSYSFGFPVTSLIFNGWTVKSHSGEKKRSYQINLVQ